MDSLSGAFPLCFAPAFMAWYTALSSRWAVLFRIAFPFGKCSWIYIYTYIHIYIYICKYVYICRLSP
ncbi:uncharacterized protein LY79DRAFT_545243 [Colletotrichum navitas]|uniref:Uncharacterized protein n=1 Tax=Colletotrichum navitas TaxID=681940 RepID=A0AAD8Q6C5_9PEZI|nr:uncharacterized protein LY79DRAFT_545243 [Colletotrichum navitas]KAK1596068.1 hypothetical protein LY79DRAFT_545243 [Colletotrichum navitas]